MTSLKGTVIDDLIERHSQGWSRTVTTNIDGRRVRVVIYRDFYSSQSRLHSDVWSPDRLDWNRVQTISGANHAYLPSSATSTNHEGREQIRTATDSLVNSMLNYVREVLG